MGSLQNDILPSPAEDDLTLADDETKDLAARHFQLELFEVARQQNVIICLGTGTGKTFISVLLIKELLHQTQHSLEEGGRRTVFLAPTVPLVQQQALYLRRHLNAKVASFVGAMRVDDWTGIQWWAEFNFHKVLVMTPCILNNILNANFISLNNINLIVFDECHSATGKDPYVQIMQNHYLSALPSCRPRILGLTASVLNKKVKMPDIMSSIEELECKLGANLVTALSAVDYITRPREVLIKHSNGNTRTVITSHTKVTPGVNDILAVVGPYGCLEVITRKTRQLNNMILSGMAKESKIEEARVQLKAYEEATEVISSWNCPLDDASDKAWRLVDILDSFRVIKDPLCGIVFATERATVFALCRWIQAIVENNQEKWGFIKSDFIIGQNGMSLYGPEYGDGSQIPDMNYIRHQEKVLRDFRSKQLNLLFATSVIEEGVDIPACNLVVRYDPPKNMRSYVQSRGRARCKPAVYALFCTDKETATIQNNIYAFKNIEFQLLRYCNSNPKNPIDSSQMFLHLYNQSQLSNIQSRVHPNNCRAIITPFAARQILQWYCDTLDSDRYTLQKPEYIYEQTGDTSPFVRCGIQLPRQSVLQEVTYGQWDESIVTARTTAALHALKRLYDLGELSEHMLPKKKKIPLEVTIDELLPEVAALFQNGPATQTNRILCNRAISQCMTPSNIDSFPVTLHMYALHTHIVKWNDEPHLDDDKFFDPRDEPTDMGLLLMERLPLTIPIYPIYTRAGMEHVKVIYCGEVTLDKEEFGLCADFNEYVFKEVLKIPAMVFHKKQVPVVVPVLDGTLNREVMKTVFSEEPIPLTCNSVVNVEATENVNLHEKRCYVVKVFTGKLGDEMLIPKRVQKRLEMIHPRNEDRLGNVSKKTTLRGPRTLAPKLAANCFVERLSASLWNKSASLPSIVYRVNRLALVEQFRVGIVQSTGLGKMLPTEGEWKPLQMERMAGHRYSQLHLDDTVIPSMNFSYQPDLTSCDGPSPIDVMKALTPLHANDIVDSERLEVIGDSFLKIAVTLHLYQEFETASEGALTSKRCRVVSNMNLLQHAVPRKIHENVEAVMFRVRVNFIPPGASEVAPLSGDFIKSDIPELSRACQYYRSKICADSIEALIGVYLEHCGPVGALEFLRWLDIKLGRFETGDFIDRFELPVTEALAPERLGDFERWQSEIVTVEQTLGYQFTNKLLALEAITHKSYRYNRLTRSYERLEFLGDAVIDYVISRYIYTADPDLNPGQLTDVRASLVSNNTFASIIVDNNLHQVMQHHSPLLHKLTSRFVEYRETEKKLDYLVGDEETEDLEQVDIPKPLGDLLESLMGAVFLDSGKSFEKVWEVLVKLMTVELLKDAVINVRMNNVRELSEMFPTEAVFHEPEHLESGRIAMRLTVQDKEFEATARNKKVAKVVLAKKALRFFRRNAQREVEAQDVLDSVIL